MLSPLDVITDHAGRITHFVHPDHDHETIDPVRVGAQITGGERVMLKGVEYDITPEGSLVHPDVELHDTVILGSGVRIGEGTEFAEMISDGDSPLETIVVGNGTRIEGTKISDPVTIGRFAVILAKCVGPRTRVGDHSRIGKGVELQSGVLIGDGARIDRDALIATGAQVHDHARIGFKAWIGPAVVVGHHSRIGRFDGAGPKGVNQSGPFVMANRVLPPRTVI